MADDGAETSPCKLQVEAVGKGGLGMALGIDSLSILIRRTASPRKRY